MATEADKLLSSFLKRLQQNARVRKTLAICLLLGMVGLAGYFVYDIIPRHYNLSITGGDILSNRHYLARSLREEAAGHDVNLEIQPVSGSQEALVLVDEGKLDMAFVQGGLENHYTNVMHVATVAPELLHFLVRPEIKDISDLRGKRVNMGSRKGGTRVIAKQVLAYSSLTEGVDYVESNISAEDLLSMRETRLPDAIVISSFAPSDVADFLIKQRGYTILEIPFPASLALRLGWVANGKILAYTYNVKPPVPAKDIQAVGVNLHLVANRNVDPRAVFRVLESLYNPALEVKLGMKIDESQMIVPSGFALSEGTRMFIARKDPLLSSSTVGKIQSLFGLILSIVSTIVIVFRWFRGEPDEPEKPPVDDHVFLDYLMQVSDVEQDFNESAAHGRPGSAFIRELHARLSAIKAEALACMHTARFDNMHLPHNLLLAIADARARINAAGSSNASPTDQE